MKKEKLSNIMELRITEKELKELRIIGKKMGFKSLSSFRPDAANTAMMRRRIFFTAVTGPAPVDTSASRAEAFFFAIWSP